MKIVTLEVSSVADVKRRALEAFKGKKQRARIGFGHTRTAVAGAYGGAMGAAQGFGRTGAAYDPRDFAPVNARREGRPWRRARALLDAGLLEKAEDGRIVFRFDAVHVDFTVHAA